MKVEEKFVYSYLSKLKIEHDNFPIHKCFTKMWSDFNVFVNNKQKVEMDIFSTLYDVPMNQIDKRIFEQKVPKKPSHFDEKNIRQKTAPVKTFKIVKPPQRIDELFIPKIKVNSYNLKLKEKMRKNNNNLNFHDINYKFIGSSHKGSMDKDIIYWKMISFIRTLFKKKKKVREVLFEENENEGDRTNYDKYRKCLQKSRGSSTSNEIQPNIKQIINRHSLVKTFHKDKNMDYEVMELINNLNKNVENRNIKTSKRFDVSDNTRIFEHSYNKASPEKKMEIKKNLDKTNIKDIHKMLIEKLQEVNAKYIELKENNEKEYMQYFPTKLITNKNLDEKLNKEPHDLNEKTFYIKHEKDHKNLKNEGKMIKSKSLGNILGDKKLITKNFIIK